MLALDATTYLDMLVRGRPPSLMPEASAASLAARLGIDISGDDTASASRRSGLGWLLGHASGLAYGAGFGALGPRLPAGRRTAVGAALGLVVIAGNNTWLVVSGLTDPREWGIVGWLEELVPHVVFGVGTAAAYDALSEG
jgi:hypothetical protein